MLRGSQNPLSRAFDGALTDLDGVCYQGTAPVAHAAEAIHDARADGLRFLFVTNNASRTPQEAALKLTGVGIPAREADVFTASQATVMMVEQQIPVGSKVLVVGTTGLRQPVSDAGFELVDSADDSPVAVIQGFGPDVGWRELAEATYAVERGARYFVTNMDYTLPTERGFAPGNGSLVAAVVQATGVIPPYAGKPAPEIFGHAASILGSRNPLAIGDRLDTDHRGANAAHIPSLLVLTGVDSIESAAASAPSDRPSFVAADLRGLLEPHPSPQFLPDSVRVRSSSAAVVDGRVEVVRGADDTSGMDGARAGLCAAWLARDAGESVATDSLASVGPIDAEVA